MTQIRWICAWAGALAAASLLIAPAQARPQVHDIRFGEHASGTRVVVELDAEVDYRAFALSEGGARIVVDFEPVDWRARADRVSGGQVIGAARGIVARYRFAQNSPTRSRLVLDLEGPARIDRQLVLAPEGDVRRHRLVLDLAHASGASRPAAVAPPAPAEPADEIVVVLDPGHGGRDPGALGARTDVPEKDVNLAVARVLRDRLQQRGRYKVVLTREDDRFLDLQQRVRIAREAKADLFISIHADSSRDSRARGASVYTLAERSTARARNEILSEQNWLIDVELEGRSADVNDILVDLAQRETKNRSADFAALLIPRLRAVGPVVRNTHRSAGYYVLLAPDVPAVLLETGFLSDVSDEKRLRSSRHRERIAESVAAAIDEFFSGEHSRA
ncbi:MAG: N-acetylmuramoyl-L-alanine amidase [Caulobacterales bacterium]|nr:N-acetylmuramoyl-L-alanine amidase [Caulobacterales bacterium]